MNGFTTDISAETKRNVNFLRVLYTGRAGQLAVMRLRPGEDTGEETHPASDEFFCIEEGEGVVAIEGIRQQVGSRSGIFIPAGARHSVLNLSKTLDLKFFTVTAPPLHQDMVLRKTRQEAVARADHFDGKTTE